MAITPVSIPFDVSDILGVDYDARRTKLFIRTNIDGDAIVDADGNTLRVGTAYAKPDDNGVGSFDNLIPTNAATNPTNFQYEVVIDYPPRDPKATQHNRWSSGWFSLTATTNLADVIAEQYVPPTFMTTATNTLQGYVDQGKAYRDDQAAIAGLTGEDTAVANLVGNTSSSTRGALDGAFAPRISLFRPEEHGAVGDGVTDDTTALQATIDACKAAGGGRIALGAKDYAHATALDWSNMENVEVVSVARMGVKGTLGVGKPARLIYTGTATPAHKTNQVSGMSFQGVNLLYSNAGFTGTLFQGGSNVLADVDTTGLKFIGCTLAGTATTANVQASTGACNASALFDPSGCDTVVFDDCTFAAAQRAISRPDARLAFADIVVARVCKFLPTIWGAHVYNPGNSWTFDRCKIHGSTDLGGGGTRTPAFIRFSSSFGSRILAVVKVDGCMFTDCGTNVAAAWIEFMGRSISVTGCNVLEGGGTSGYLLKLVDICESVTISGNNVAINAAVDFNAIVCRGAAITGNTFLGSGPIATGRSGGNVYNFVKAGNGHPTETDEYGSGLSKGALRVGTSTSAQAVLPAGSTGYTLVTDPTQTTGLKWAAPSGGVSEAHVDWTRPTGAKRVSVARNVPWANNLAALTSGTLSLVGVYLEAGDVVSTISFLSGTTAAASPTAQWFELRDANRNLLAQTADDGTTAWAASATKTLSLTTPYTVPSAGLYYLGVCVVATTVPTLSGVNLGTNVGSIMAPRLAGATNTGLTNPASSPATTSTITAGAQLPYAATA